MHKQILSAALSFTLFAGSAIAAETPHFGAVNFTSCVTDSKLGKKEQENLESLRKQMFSLMENTEKELKEISAKFEDTEYLDSLSPKAEEELKGKYQTLQEDLGRYQNQFSQISNQAYYQMIQKMSNTIASAAEKVAKEKNLKYVANKEAFFFIAPEFDLTTLVIDEMDKSYEIDAKAKKISDNSEEIQAVEPSAQEKAG